MPIDVATAAADYLPIVETLNKVFERASNGPLTRNELDSVWVTLPPEGRLASAGICRLALKRLAEVLDYKYMLRSQVDATPQELSDAGNDMKEIFGTIFKCVPKPLTLLNSLGILDRYFYALGVLADLLYALGSVERTRIIAGPAIDQTIERHREKVQDLRRSLERLIGSDDARRIQAPESPGAWSPGGVATELAKNTSEAERNWLGAVPPPTIPMHPSAKSYDVFISHATEDKDDLVRELATALRERGLTIWYDEFELKVGDSLRRSIDRGLSASRFGIVVLSPSFLAKNWPQYELDGLVAKEIGGSKVILPLWHRITRDEVMKYSPSLVDKVALNTATFSIADLADKLAEATRA